MHYVKYQHVEKLGSSEVAGILEGTCYISYKLDGTNSVVWLQDDGTLGFGSRRRVLNITEDNAGFLGALSSDAYSSVYNDLLAYLKSNPFHIIYGEWLVGHTLRTYQEDAWKKFYVFDIFDAETEKYINYDIYSKNLSENYPNITYIPLLAKLDNPTKEQVEECLNKSGDYLVREGLGEGVVIKNYEYTNKYGRIVWAKLLTEDFRARKKDKKISSKSSEDDNDIEYQISLLLTPEHILKEQNKIIECYGEWTNKNIPELLNRTFNEFWRDNWENILKKFKFPTINFKVLKKLCADKVKEFLNIY